jgi:hypothetical protein
MRAVKRDAKGRRIEDPGQSLARRIRIWAKSWRRCPKKGCRRASRCLRFDDCAAVSKASSWPTAREKRRLFDPMRAAIRRLDGRGPPAHDPEAPQDRHPRRAPEARGKGNQ